MFGILHYLVLLSWNKQLKTATAFPSPQHLSGTFGMPCTPVQSVYMRCVISSITCSVGFSHGPFASFSLHYFLSSLAFCSSSSSPSLAIFFSGGSPLLQPSYCPPTSIHLPSSAPSPSISTLRPTSYVDDSGYPLSYGGLRTHTRWCAAPCLPTNRRR